MTFANYVPPLNPRNIKRDLQKKFEERSHVAKIDVVNEQNEVSSDIMNHLQANAIPPYLYVDYITQGHIYDGGNAQFKITPSVLFSDSSSKANSTDISWLYPIPLSDFSSKLVFHIPEPHTVGITIPVLRKAYYVLHHEHMEPHYGQVATAGNNVLKISLFQQVSNVAVRNSIFAFSSDEFETSHLKK
uniref:Uncharacterized protein n=1 Tax=Ciona savignyi TaxID=51511 RepID=H2YT34_CIOSA